MCSGTVVLCEHFKVKTLIISVAQYIIVGITIIVATGMT